MKKFRISQLLRATGDSSNFKYEVATLKVHASSKFTLPPARAGARACQILRVLLVSWPPSLAAGLRRRTLRGSGKPEETPMDTQCRSRVGCVAAWQSGTARLRGNPARLCGSAARLRGCARPRGTAARRERRLPPLAARVARRAAMRRPPCA